jgi:phytanoyl-CoA hydroxylase
MQTFSDNPAAALQLYATTGVHLEPDVLDVALCDELISIAMKFESVKAGNFRTVLQPHRTSEPFMHALRHPGVTRIMQGILGGAISGIQTQFFYGKPGTPGFQPHQDNRFVNAPQGQFASAWVALTDVSPENGGLYIYPGTFREPLLDIEEVEAQATMLQDDNALRLKCVVPSKYQLVDVVLKKGGAAFFDGHTVHGSYENAANTWRYALLMTYVARGAKFEPGRYAQREEVAID